jgi:hypothetical protein
MLTKIIKQLNEKSNRDPRVGIVCEAPRRDWIRTYPVNPKPIMPMVRTANETMNWYFQHGYPYPANIGSFF